MNILWLMPNRELGETLYFPGVLEGTSLVRSTRHSLTFIRFTDLTIIQVGNFLDLTGDMSRVV